MFGCRENRRIEKGERERNMEEKMSIFCCLIEKKKKKSGPTKFITPDIYRRKLKRKHIKQTQLLFKFKLKKELVHVRRPHTKFSPNGNPYLKKRL